MANEAHTCPACGAGVTKARWDYGYHYCKDPMCYVKLGKPKKITIDAYDADELRRAW